MTSVELRRNTAGRPGEAAAPPRGSSGTGRPRSTRRTRRARGRSSHRAGRSRPRPPRRAETRSRSSPSSAAPSRVAPGVMSTPTGRAPLFASQAEKYAVPQPSSTTSSPAKSAGRSVGLVDPPDAPGDLVERPVRLGASRRCTRRSPASRRAVRSASLRQSIREPEPDLALGRLGRVRAVHEVVRHREGELAAERARVGVGGVRRADRLARRGDRAFALEHERERRPRRDEVDELAEERLLAVLGVVRLAELADAVRSRAARSFSPRRSKRARISPARLRPTASGFARISVRSTAMRPRRLPAALAADQQPPQVEAVQGAGAAEFGGTTPGRRACGRACDANGRIVARLAPGTSSRAYDARPGCRSRASSRRATRSARLLAAGCGRPGVTSMPDGVHDADPRGPSTRLLIRRATRPAPRRAQRCDARREPSRRMHVDRRAGSRCDPANAMRRRHPATRSGRRSRRTPVGTRANAWPSPVIRVEPAVAQANASVRLSGDQATEPIGAKATTCRSQPSRDP